MSTYSRRNFISSVGITLSITIEGSDEFAKALLTHAFWREFIPGFSSDSQTESLQEWVIREQPQTMYDLEHRIICMTIDTVKMAIVIIDAVFERLRQEQGLYTLHGSYIGNGATAVGFVGAISGLGKTTLCAHATTQGWLWLGDEKFVLDAEGTVVAGVESILNDAKTATASAGSLPAPDNIPRTLKMLCIPIVTSETEVTVHALDLPRREWQFYDEVTRDIRQINGMLRGFPTPLPSLDTNQLSQQRQQTALKWAETLPIVYVRGNKEAIFQWIETNA